MAERWLQPAQELEIRRALAAGRVIEAIKLYRTATGVGLKEAKDACDAMAAERWVGPGDDDAPTTPPAQPPPRAAEETGGGLAWEDRQRVSELLFGGQKIQAIKLYRERTGVGLKEAKDAVEAMETELRGTHALRFKHAKGGCLGMLLLAAGTGLCAAIGTVAV